MLVHMQITLEQQQRDRLAAIAQARADGEVSSRALERLVGEAVEAYLEDQEDLALAAARLAEADKRYTPEEARRALGLVD